MRTMFCWFLLLPACASHEVRCDGHLRPINPPAVKATAGAMPEPGAIHARRKP
jgi:hypothetical protein